MNIFDYGRIYSKLSVSQLNSLKIAPKLNEGLSYLVKLYFFLFGYPDIASQKRYVIVEKLLRPKKAERILDAGCGNGIYLQEFGHKFKTGGTGVDACKNRITNAKRINKYLGGNNLFLTSMLERVNLGKKKFDKVICLEVLEHIKDDGGVLSRLPKNLVKGGLFIISVPIKGTVLSKQQEDDPNFKPEKYGHVRSGYEILDLKKMAKNAGLEIILIQKYFFLVSRYMVKIQQFLYKKNFIFLNMLFSPILLVISELDNIFRFYPRGYMLVLRKK